MTAPRPKGCVPEAASAGGGSGSRSAAAGEAEVLAAHVDALVAGAMRRSSLTHVDAVSVPSREAVIGLADCFLEILFPGFFGRTDLTADSLPYHLGAAIHAFHRRLSAQLARCLRHACERGGAETCEDCEGNGRRIAAETVGELPRIRDLLESDVEAAFCRDPALRSRDEAIVASPGIYAVAVNRVAHELWRRNVPIMPRILAEHAHSTTGIDIHPGATIGRSFFIDHGTGVVIGETTEIGERVTLYQGVTLGALRIPRDQECATMRGVKRHPTLEDDVTVYGGATILGPVRIGARSVVGGNAWLTTDIPPDTKVVMDAPRLVMTTNSTGH